MISRVSNIRVARAMCIDDSSQQYTFVLCYGREIDTSPSLPVISSRKASSGWTTTISLRNNQIRKWQVWKSSIATSIHNASNRAKFIQAGDDATNLKGTLRALLWRSLMLRARSIIVIILATLFSILSFVCSSTQIKTLIRLWALSNIQDINAY